MASTDDVIRLQPTITGRLKTGKIIDIHGIVGSVMSQRIRLFECVHPFVQSSLTGMFEVCRSVSGIIAAGGCVSQLVNAGALGLGADVHATIATDLDLYPRANTADEVEKIVKRLCEYLAPVGEVIMSKYAITFTVDGEAFKKRVLKIDDDAVIMAHRNPMYYGGWDPHPVYKVQLIAQAIPDTGDLCRDLSSLFAHYDLPCCKFATDGKDVYSCRDAISTVFETRVNRVHWTRLHSTKRIAKYYGRCYDFEIEMPNGDVVTSVPDGHTNAAPALEDTRNLIKESLRFDYYHDGISLCACTRSLIIDQIYNIESDGPDSCYVKSATTKTRNKGPWWVLDAAFDRYVTSAASANPDHILELNLICGNPGDLLSMITTGKIPHNTIVDWSMMRMNKFCEGLCSLYTCSDLVQEQEADAERERFGKEIGAFIEAISKSNGLSTPFTSGCKLEYENISEEEFMRKWIVPNTKRTHPDAEEFAPLEKSMRYPIYVASAPDVQGPNPRKEELLQQYSFSDTDPDSLCMFDSIKLPIGVKYRFSTSPHVFNNFKIYLPRMYLPAGICQFVDGGFSVLLSTGYDTSKRMLEFKEFMGTVENKLKQIITNTEWAVQPYGFDGNLGLSTNGRMMYSHDTNVESFVPYPPSIKIHPDEHEHCILAIESPDGTLISTEWNAHAHADERMADVVLTLDWVFRRQARNPKRWIFSSHWSASEMVLRHC